MSRQLGFSPSTPLACDPQGIAAAERPAHFALIQTLFAEHSALKTEVRDGYAYEFAAASADDVFRFVANERKCCPFLSFDIEISPNEGPIFLRMTGPEGTREFLDAELPV